MRLGSRANAEEALNNPRFSALSSDGAERLAEAEAMMKAGATAGEILLKLAKDGGNPNHLPCGSPEGGRFCSPGAVGGVSAQDGGKIVDKAPKWANTPYAPLGTPLAGLNAVPGKDGGADCSGSVHAIYVDAGYSYTYTNSGNFAASAANGSIPFKEVSESERQPGDVVLYPGHMSIYAGDGMVWSAHQTGVAFRISSVTVFRGAPRYFRYQR